MTPHRIHAQGATKREQGDGKGIHSRLISCPKKKVRNKLNTLKPPAALGQQDGQIERQNADKLLSESGCGCACVDVDVDVEVAPTPRA